jgi:hypothetical protein
VRKHRRRGRAHDRDKFRLIRSAELRRAFTRMATFARDAALRRRYIGVSLLQMRDPAAARAHVPVGSCFACGDLEDIEHRVAA